MGTVNVLEAARALRLGARRSSSSPATSATGTSRTAAPSSRTTPWAAAIRTAPARAAPSWSRPPTRRASSPTGRGAVASARAGNVIGGGDWAADRIVPDCVRALAAGEPVVVRNPDAVRPWQHVLEPLAGYLLAGARMPSERRAVVRRRLELRAGARTATRSRCAGSSSGSSRSGARESGRTAGRRAAAARSAAAAPRQHQGGGAARLGAAVGCADGGAAGRRLVPALRERRRRRRGDSCDEDLDAYVDGAARAGVAWAGERGRVVTPSRDSDDLRAADPWPRRRVLRGHLGDPRSRSSPGRPACPTAAACSAPRSSTCSSTRRSTSG